MGWPQKIQYKVNELFMVIIRVHVMVDIIDA